MVSILYSKKKVKPKKGKGSFKRKKNKMMDLIFILKILSIFVSIVGLYAIARNLDIIKIILIYWKDIILGK